MAIKVINKEESKYNFDLATAIKSDDIVLTAKESGFRDIIIEIIKKELNNNGMLSSLFVEFNLVGSILAPDSPNKLTSLLFLQENKDNPGFSDNIKKYNDSIISTFVEKRKYTLFFHPDVFIDPEKPQVCYDIIDGVLNEDTVEYKNLIKEGKSDYFEKISDKTYIGKTTFPRDYYTLLDKASKIRDEKKNVNDELNEFHRLYHYFIGNIDRSTVYLTIPILGARASNRISAPNINNIQGQGVIFIFFTIPEGLDGDLDLKVQKVAENLFFELGDFVRLLSYNYLFNLGLQLQEKARAEALKSAKAAIMSRNMSHNIGSHVMAYLKQHLSSVRGMLNDRILSDLLQDESALGKEVNATTDNAALPFLVGLGHFVSYLQERQDFIATIATDYIPYYSNINFKDGIYDNLNPDKRHDRHKDDENHTNETNPPIDNILLGNIARSEGYGRQTKPTENDADLHDIILKFGAFDGNKVNDSDKKKEKSFKRMKDTNISIPGGIVGRQAIFSILENVIRNAAKHGDGDNLSDLEFTWEVYTKHELEKEWEDKVDTIKEVKPFIADRIIKNREIRESSDCPKKESLKDEINTLCSKEDYIEENVYCDKYCDNISEDLKYFLSNYFDAANENHLSLYEVLQRYYFKANDADDLYFVTLTDNIHIEESSLEGLRKAISEPYVDEQGELIGSNKGIKEMRISASWLRSIKDDTLELLNQEEKKKYDRFWVDPVKLQTPPVLYARISKQNGENHLQYIICISRPKKVAIISSDFENDCNYNKKLFVENSWGVFTPDNFKKTPNKSYEFILLDNKDEGKYNDLREVSSSRLYFINDFADITQDDVKGISLDNIKSSSFNLEMMKKYELILYKKLANYNNNDNDVICIEDQRTVGKYGEQDIFYVEDKPSIVVYDGKSKSDQVQKIIASSPQVFLYRTHHEAIKEFRKFYNKSDKDIFTYVEGVTGANSTDRLIRNENIDSLWFYKHLHSIKQKVAIFDERIFSKILGLEESNLIGTDVGKSVTSENCEAKWEEYKEKLKNEMNSDLAQYRKKITETEGLNKTELIEFLNDYFNIDKETANKAYCLPEVQSSFLASAYKNKNIYVYTIIKDPNCNEFHLYGISPNNDLNVESFKSKCVRLITFSYNEGKLCFRGDFQESQDVFYMSFDRLSIHQGLLDKLYSAFGLKNDKEAKEAFTKCFFDYFTRKKEGKSYAFLINDKNNKEEEYEKWFLPGMCIHSGRSKPNENDMPQHIPFIQYASIEHAVLDCKFSLVELLDFARYE